MRHPRPYVWAISVLRRRDPTGRPNFHSVGASEACATPALRADLPAMQCIHQNGDALCA